MYIEKLQPAWSYLVDDDFRRRLDDDGRTIVNWSAGRTAYARVWTEKLVAPHEAPTAPHDAIARTLRRPRPLPITEYRSELDGVVTYAYVLRERAWGLYTLVAVTGSLLQLACYFDVETDLAWALNLSRSVRFGDRSDDGIVYTPTPPEESGHSGGYAIVSRQVLELGRKIGWIYREEPDDPQDSGWRVFSGAESDEYVDTPENFAVVGLDTLVALDADVRDLLAQPVGSRFEWDEAARSLQPVLEA